jgi:hypothetical protein
MGGKYRAELKVLHLAWSGHGCICGGMKGGPVEGVEMRVRVFRIVYHKNNGGGWIERFVTLKFLPPLDEVCEVNV